MNLCFGHVGRDNIKESQSCDGSDHLVRRLKIVQDHTTGRKKRNHLDSQHILGTLLYDT